MAKKKKKYKRTNNGLQNIYIYKTKDRVTRTPLKTGCKVVMRNKNLHYYRRKYEKTKTKTIHNQK